MSATATPPRLTMTREEAAECLLELLTDEPQSMSSLAAQLGYEMRTSGGGIHSSAVPSGLRVLESRQQAKQIPNTAGSKAGGWARWDSAHEAALADPQHMDFPYDFKIVKFAEMFVDATYQRPLTNFAKRIEKRFDPVLFQTLTLSDRGTKHRPRRHAIIDGQTRWVAASNIGVIQGPSCVFKGLSPQDEADIFWRLQKERRGHVSWHGFRAKLGAGDEQAHRIKALVEDAGYVLGDRPGQLKAVGALEKCYKTDPFQLERTLSDLREAWGTTVPEGRYVRGMHYFFRHYPIDSSETREVNDEKLVRRLKVNGPQDLLKKQLAVREIHTGAPEKLMALAIQAAYHSR